MMSMFGVLSIACGSVPSSQFGDSAPFASNDEQCASASLGNEPDDDEVLSEALDCLFAEYDAGNPVTIDIAVATVEGDPIFHRYRYDGDTVLIVEDSRADEFGAGSVRARVCADIVRGRRLPDSNDCERVNHPGFPEAD